MKEGLEGGAFYWGGEYADEDLRSEGKF